MSKPRKKNEKNVFSKRVLFNSRTFNSKLFLKLTTPYISKSIVCIQTLRYERENRNINDIEAALPWLQTIPELNKFINLKETPESSHKLLVELVWLLFYKYYSKNIVLKKAGEREEFIFISLGGKILKLKVIYERVHITLEEYLVYLIKLEIIHEKQILKNCRKLNLFYADINGENIIKFCKDNPQFKYEKLRDRAEEEITKLGFNVTDFEEEKINVHSIDNYIEIASIKNQIKIINDGTKASPELYIGKYVKVGYIKRGEVIGNLTKQFASDNTTYICEDNCDVAYLNKNLSKMDNLYDLIIEKKRKILSEIKNKFLIFNNISDEIFNELIPFFEYKSFHQGEKIFVQNSLYEGIYIIKQGEVNIYLDSAVNDLGDYISRIKYSLSGFQDYVTRLTTEENNEKEDIIIKPDISDYKMNLTKEKSNTLREIKKYDIMTIPEGSLFGTNEYYDYKTQLYYFSAECMSKDAIIYFLPKKYFYSLLIKEKPIYLALMNTVESKIIYIIGKLKHYIKIFEIIMNKKNKEILKKKPLKLNLNLKWKNFNENKNNNIIVKSSKNLQPNNMTIYRNITKENSYELPSLIEKRRKFFTNYKTSNNDEGRTISFFTGKNNNNNKNNYHSSIREKIIFNSYKKTSLRLSKARNPFELYINKKIKNFEDKLLSSEEKNRLKNKKEFTLNLPSHFPFTIQNTFNTFYNYTNSINSINLGRNTKKFNLRNNIFLK